MVSNQTPLCLIYMDNFSSDDNKIKRIQLIMPGLHLAEPC